MFHQSKTSNGCDSYTKDALLPEAIISQCPNGKNLRIRVFLGKEVYQFVTVSAAHQHIIDQSNYLALFLFRYELFFRRQFCKGAPSPLHSAPEMLFHK